MLKVTTRLCVLRDKVIPDTYIACGDHIEEYKLYGQEPWFKYCIEAQRRQFEIDLEQYNLENGALHNTRAYIKLTELEKSAISWLFNKGLGAKNISKILKINYNTVNSFTRGMKRKVQNKQ